MTTTIMMMVNGAVVGYAVHFGDDSGGTSNYGNDDGFGEDVKMRTKMLLLLIMINISLIISIAVRMVAIITMTMMMMLVMMAMMTKGLTDEGEQYDIDDDRDGTDVVNAAYDGDGDENESYEGDTEHN